MASIAGSLWISAPASRGATCGMSMRSLRPLALRTRGVVPDGCLDLDLWSVRRCVSVQLEFSTDPDDPCSSAVFCVETDEGQQLTFQCDGVRSLSLPKMTPNLWINQLEIEDVRDRGWEGIAYTLHSGDPDDLELVCHCRDIVIIGTSQIA